MHNFELFHTSGLVEAFEIGRVGIEVVDLLVGDVEFILEVGQIACVHEGLDEYLEEERKKFKKL